MRLYRASGAIYSDELPGPCASFDDIDLTVRRRRPDSRGKDRRGLQKKDIEGGLAQQIEHAGDVLKLYFKSEVKIEGFKKEFQYELPLEVLREAVVNAVAHRNYQIPSQIRIFIFEDRIEVISPSRPPNTVTLDNIKLGI